MFKIEIYRILSKRVTQITLLAAAFIIGYYSLFALWGEGVIDGREIYQHASAVAKNVEIAEEFAGPLTEETVLAIWEKYGPPVNYFDRSTTEDHMLSLAGTGVYDNYCNLFVARLFAEKSVGEDGEAVLVLRENLAESRYLQGNYTFGYVGEGWRNYWDQFLVLIIEASLVVIIALSPAFSQDYAYRTADYLLPAAKGRLYLWCVRTGAGCLFATVYYWILSFILFGIQMSRYGGNGLQVSCALAGIPMYGRLGAVPVWQAILQMHLTGWFSVLVLTFLVQAVSAESRQSFNSLMWSLCIYFAPFGFMRLVLD